MLVARTFTPDSHLSLVPSLADDGDDGTDVETPRIAPPRPEPALVPLRARTIFPPPKVRATPPRPASRPPSSPQSDIRALLRGPEADLLPPLGAIDPILRERDTKHEEEHEEEHKPAAEPEVRVAVAQEDPPTLQLSELDFEEVVNPTTSEVELVALVAPTRSVSPARVYAVAFGSLAVRLVTLVGRGLAATFSRFRTRVGRRMKFCALEWRRAIGRTQRRLLAAGPR
jgi:hypothetical protein